MGECNYYLKARFRSAQAAEAAVGKLLPLLEQGEKAYLFWQANRSHLGRGRDKREAKTPEEFWRLFKERFPAVLPYLGDLVDGDTNNALSGWMGCLCDPKGESCSLSVEGNQIVMILRDIWHFTETSRLEDYFREALGAEAFACVSQEDLDDFADEDEEDEDEEEREGRDDAFYLSLFEAA